MPEIFRFFGFSFFLFSREHEPIHVHVEGNGGCAKYEYDGEKFVFNEQQGIKANDLKKISAVIDENCDIILNYWNNYFNK